MKLSLDWLATFVKTSTPAEQLAEKFQLTSSVVDAIYYPDQNLEKVIVAEILEVKKHPNADKLNVLKVSTGSKKSTIVCGATNVVTGAKVALALPGAKVFSHKGEEITIEISKIRGVISEGMICAASELSLQFSHQADREILILPEKSILGEPVITALNLDKPVLDLEITPNRTDLLSVYGLAREVSAFEKKSLLEVPIASLEVPGDQLPDRVEVDIDNEGFCSRYSAICLENIKILPSPLWLQARLINAGVKPINNVVDIANYVMLELGQPLHTFDYERLSGEEHRKYLNIRLAKAGETLKTLDQVSRTLQGGEIVICNAQDQPIDLAGIMGGDSSSITPTTSRILLESATFQGARIRRSARALGLRTEASSRFEKGLDPEMTVTALKRAVYLLQEHAGATISSSLVDMYSHGKPNRPRIHLTFDTLQQLTGVHISAAEAKLILQKLGFQVPVLNKSALEVIPPTWRADVTLPEDIIEELLRLWGFERIPHTLPKGEFKAPIPNSLYETKKTLRHTGATLGLNETIHLTLTSPSTLEKSLFKPENSILLTDPFSKETSYLIPSHLPHFLQNSVTTNAHTERLAFFEIGHCFSPEKTEEERLSLFLSDSSLTEEAQIRLAKTQVQRLLSSIGLANSLEFIPQQEGKEPVFLASVAIMVQNTFCGELGVLSPRIRENWKVKGSRPLTYAWLNIDRLLELPSSPTSYKSISLYPTSKRTLSVKMKEEQPLTKLETWFKENLDPQLVSDWYIDTIYRGTPLAKDQKSVTIQLFYNNQQRTLSDFEINHDLERLEKHLTIHLS